LATDGATVMEEASRHLVKFWNADIDEINEQLTIRTDYESDAYMKLIERVSDLSEKFYIEVFMKLEHINRSRVSFERRIKDTTLSR
jgi:hypothetical protein